MDICFSEESVLQKPDMQDKQQNQQNQQKKRGRPKNTDTQLYTLKKEKMASMQQDTHSSEEELILHLKIDTLSDSHTTEQERSDEKKILKKKVKEQIKKDDKEYDVELQHIIQNISSKPQIIKSVDSSNYVEQLERENNELKNYISENSLMFFTEVKIYPTDLKLFTLNENKECIPIPTNKKCWWCT